MSQFARDTLWVTGAYGRNACEKDWNDGKDFQIQFGPYFSIRDCEAMKTQGIKCISFMNSVTGYAAFHVELDK